MFFISHGWEGGHELLDDFYSFPGYPQIWNLYKRWLYKQIVSVSMKKHKQNKNRIQILYRLIMTKYRRSNLSKNGTLAQILSKSHCSKRWIFLDDANQRFSVVTYTDTKRLTKNKKYIWQEAALCCYIGDWKMFGTKCCLYLSNKKHTVV